MYKSKVIVVFLLKHVYKSKVTVVFLLKHVYRQGVSRVKSFLHALGLIPMQSNLRVSVHGVARILGIKGRAQIG